MSTLPEGHPSLLTIWTYIHHMYARVFCEWDVCTANKSIHDDVIKWNYFPRYWLFVRGIHRSAVNSPHKGQWRGALMCSLICAWINGWVNNREVGDLSRHGAHYDVSIMTYACFTFLDIRDSFRFNNFSFWGICTILNNLNHTRRKNNIHHGQVSFPKCSCLSRLKRWTGNVSVLHLIDVNIPIFTTQQIIPGGGGGGGGGGGMPARKRNILERMKYVIFVFYFVTHNIFFKKKVLIESL